MPAARTRRVAVAASLDSVVIIRSLDAGIRGVYRSIPAAINAIRTKDPAYVEGQWKIRTMKVGQQQVYNEKGVLRYTITVHSVVN